MNANEFLNYLNRHLDPKLGKVTAEDLKKWDEFGVLRPHPEYFKDDFSKVTGLINLMKKEQKRQKASAASGGSAERPATPRLETGTISQVLSIFSEDRTRELDFIELTTIKQASMRTGLISTLGYIFINFSPFSGKTLESMENNPETKALFDRASASKEFLIVRETQQFENASVAKETLIALSPVLFFRGTKPARAYSTFLFGGTARLLGPGQYKKLARPLYEEFLDTDIRDLKKDVGGLMEAHDMVGDFGVPPGADDMDYLKNEQKRMGRVLLKVARGTLTVADISPLSPPHEDDMVQASILGDMGGIDVFNAELEPVSVGEIKMFPAFKRQNDQWVPYDKNVLPLRRYYRWLDYMWGELIDSVSQGSQAPVCLRCGKLLKHKRGRRKTYCGRENPGCFNARDAKYVRESRRGKRL